LSLTDRLSYEEVVLVADSIGQVDLHVPVLEENGELPKYGACYVAELSKGSFGFQVSIESSLKLGAVKDGRRQEWLSADERGGETSTASRLVITAELCGRYFVSTSPSSKVSDPKLLAAPSAAWFRQLSVLPIEVGVLMALMVRCSSSDKVDSSLDWAIKAVAEVPNCFKALSCLSKEDAEREEDSVLPRTCGRILWYDCVVHSL
jgi:hypothetical protein